MLPVMQTTSAREDWRPDLSARRGPLYLAIADALEDDVRMGRLQPGGRLPAQRWLAEALGVDLTTITRAYAEARARGLIEASVGQGTFVRALTEAPSRRCSGRVAVVGLCRVGVQ